jgi:hypothetical protein
MAAPNLIDVSSIFGKTNGVQLDTTTTTDIITCASDKLVKVNSIIVANIDGTNAADVTVYFYDNNLSHRTAIADAVTVPAKSTLVVIGKDSPALFPLLLILMLHQQFIICLINTTPDRMEDGCNRME